MWLRPVTAQQIDSVARSMQNKRAVGGGSEGLAVHSLITEVNRPSSDTWSG